MSEELKPCPFCGGPALFEGEEGAGYEVVCQHCGSRSGWGDYGYQAEAYWDKRTSNAIIEEQSARIHELEQKLRATSLEALASSDTNNELQARIAALMTERTSLIETKREQIERLTNERDAAIEAEDEAKDCFWAVYPTYCEVKGAGISTEAARTRLAVRATVAEARLSEAVKVLKAVSDTSHRARDREHYKFPLAIMEMVDAFITTLGGEKNEE